MTMPTFVMSPFQFELWAVLPDIDQPPEALEGRLSPGWMSLMGAHILCRHGSAAVTEKLATKVARTVMVESKMLICGVIGAGGDPAWKTLKSKQNWPQPPTFSTQLPWYFGSVEHAAEAFDRSVSRRYG